MQDAGDASGKSTEADRELVVWGQVAAESDFKSDGVRCARAISIRKGAERFLCRRKLQYQR